MVPCPNTPHCRLHRAGKISAMYSVQWCKSRITSPVVIHDLLYIPDLRALKAFQMFRHLKLGKAFTLRSSWVHPRDKLFPLSSVFGPCWRKEFSDPALPWTALQCRKEQPREQQREGKGGACTHIHPSPAPGEPLSLPIACCPADCNARPQPANYHLTPAQSRAFRAAFQIPVWIMMEGVRQARLSSWAKYMSEEQCWGRWGSWEKQFCQRHSVTCASASAAQAADPSFHLKSRPRQGNMRCLWWCMS